MADLIQEVDEALRVERITQTWNQYKPVIIGAIAAIILGTAIHSAWTAWVKHENRQDTTELLNVFKAEDPLPGLEKLAAQNEGHKAFAALNAAEILMEKGEKEKALALFDSLATDKGVDRAFRDLAAIQSVMISLDVKKDAKAEDLLAKLKPILADKKSPWKPNALFASALVKIHLGKDNAGAAEDLRLILADNNAPISLQQRARALVSFYGGETKKTETPGERS